MSPYGGGPVRHARADSGPSAPPTASRRKPVPMLEQTLGLGGGPPRDTLGIATGNWGEARTAIAAEFKPTVEQITSDSKPLALAKQLTRATEPRGGPPTL